MQFKKFLVLLLVIVILSISITFFLYKEFYQELKIAEIGMDLTVTERKSAYGINIDTDAIHFGMLPRGGAASRRLNLTNSYDYDIFVYIIKDNSALSGIVGISPESFVLKPYESKEIGASVRVPKGFEPGNYTGKIDVMMKVPFFRVREIKRNNPSIT